MMSGARVTPTETEKEFISCKNTLYIFILDIFPKENTANIKFLINLGIFIIIFNFIPLKITRITK